VNRKPLLQETTFDVTVQLGSGRRVRLRGKWDGVDLLRNKLYLREHKTKGQVEPERLQRQLLFDLQTGLYLFALQEHRRQRLEPKLPKAPAGVIYNVVRRPLAGGKHSIRQRKGESTDEFYERLGGLIRGEPEHYFMRWEVEVPGRHLYRFWIEFLEPVLENIWDWYVWKVIKKTNRYHWRTPYGIYNPLADGGGTDLDEYLDTGSTAGLRRIDTLFPEL